MEQIYTKKEIIKQMFKIGIPVAAQNFVSVLVNMLDTIMIGSVGEAQLGAINQVNSLYLFYNIRKQQYYNTNIFDNKAKIRNIFPTY